MNRHWHRDLAPSTAGLVDAARFERTKKGLQMIVEVIAYPKGHVNVAVSHASGSTRNRRLVQDRSLMFNDVDEAKDALDALADRLAQEAGALQEQFGNDLGQLHHGRGSRWKYSTYTSGAPDSSTPPATSGNSLEPNPAGATAIAEHWYVLLASSTNHQIEHSDVVETD